MHICNRSTIVANQQQIKEKKTKRKNRKKDQKGRNEYLDSRTISKLIYSERLSATHVRRWGRMGEWKEAEKGGEKREAREGTIKIWYDTALYFQEWRQGHCDKNRRLGRIVHAFLPKSSKASFDLFQRSLQSSHCNSEALFTHYSHSIVDAIEKLSSQILHVRLIRELCSRILHARSSNAIRKLLYVTYEKRAYISCICLQQLDDRVASVNTSGCIQLNSATEFLWLFRFGLTSGTRCKRLCWLFFSALTTSKQASLIPLLGLYSPATRNSSVKTNPETCKISEGGEHYETCLGIEKVAKMQHFSPRRS
jgi:hypothetical protein